MNSYDVYQKWLESENVSDLIKLELKKMSPDEIDDSFYKNIEFGTAGMRGILGPGTNRINVFTIRKATIAYAKYLLMKFKDARERGVVISHDNRYMSREFTFECADVLNKMGFRAFIFDSLRPTPELSFAIRFKRACGGIMITASHNPKEYNGYKVYDETGCQLTPNKIESLIKIIDGMPAEIDCKVENYELPGEFVILDYQVDHEYVNLVMSIQINPNLNKKDFKIVYSPQHGTSFVNAIRVFKKCGFRVYPLLKQCAPDPAFSGTKSPNPENESAYEESIAYAKQIGAQFICITDPDGDRVGIAARDRSGEYRLYTGNESAALLMNYIFEERERLGALSHNGVMYNTIVSSALGEKIATSYGVKTEQLLTGFKYIGDRIHYFEQNKGPDFEFGYEESYGCLISPFVRDKDGIQAILLYSEMALYYFLKNITLDEQLDSIQEIYGYHCNVTHSKFFSGSKGHQDMINILNNIRENPIDNLCGLHVNKINDYLLQKSYIGNEEKDITGLDKTNLIKFFFDNGSTICVRPSGTEPKCKFYIEAVKDNEEKAKLLEERLYNDFMAHYGIEK